MANMTSSVSASQVAGELASATFEEIPALVEHYREDPRQQVIKACERALKRHAKELSERERVNGMYELMHELGGDGVVVGVDEVGRGSVAGPLTVCAVCLPMEPRIWGINDSKKLTPARRELLSVKIADGICKAVETMMTERQFGRMCLRMIQPGFAPMERAASTYSFSLIERIWPRMSRAMPTQ